MEWYRNVQIAPDPTPGSDGHVQIGTAGGDGMVFGLAVKGPVVKNCTIQGTGGWHHRVTSGLHCPGQEGACHKRTLMPLAGDDSIDIAGHWYTVVQVLPASKALIVASTVSIGVEVYAGDTINVYAYQTYQSLGSATVASAPTVVSEPAGIPAGASDQTLFDGNQLFSAYLYFQVCVSPQLA